MRHRPVGVDVFDGCLVGGHGDAEVAGTAEHDAGFVTVFGGTPEITPRIAGLRDFLINDAVEVLFVVKMVVTVKENVDVILDE